MTAVQLTIHVQTNHGEESWNCTTWLVRENGRYFADGFQARLGERDLDWQEFVAHCVASGDGVPDLVALACDAMVSEVVS